MIGIAMAMAAVLLFLCSSLWTAIPFAFQGSMDSDVSLYFTVGRGILNGLTPYADLYESKPPGVFLLAALSLVLTGTAQIYLWTHIMMLLLIPCMLAYAGWRASATAEVRLWRIIAAGIGMILGILISLYAEQRSGAGQVEVFGAFFACAYLGTLQENIRCSPRRLLALRSCLLLCSMGLKEPFLLSTMAATLLMSKSWKDVRDDFVIPVTIAIAAGICILGILGWLGAYTTIHLQAMLHRVGGGTVDPTILRAFAVRRIYADTVTYYSAPAFGILLTSLFAFIPALKSESCSIRSWCMGIWGAVSIAALLFFAELPLTLLYVHIARPDILVRVNTFMMLSLLAISMFNAAGFLFVALRNGMLPIIIRLTLGLMLLSLTIGLGGYVGNHFVFAVPFFFAICWMTVQFIAQKPLTLSRMLIVAGIILTGALYRANPTHAEYLSNGLMNSAKVVQPHSMRMDALLDACGLDRFYAIDAFREFAFATHSPVGPLFIMNFHKYLGPNHPLFLKTIENVASIGDIFLQPINSSDPDIDLFLRKYFTTSAPDCARSIPAFEGFTVHFKKEHAGFN